ncbi:unnamed protein product [Clonostachys chloroleuca]|uniref:Inositol oxygenase n=1 Tax=Clonostachys chloroleuca TaxID=1926264 RepID=A0AA35Q7Y4_9HYPO|nr:unnamed protein product [Clonostachys chloroleuca]
MAPAAVENMLNIETTSDNIDAVNILKAPGAPKQSALYDASEFDEAKDKSTFRQFLDAEDRVKNFYATQHTLQTVAFNLKARNDFHSKTRARMGTSEAMRNDGKPRWMQLVGLIHDLGKLLFFYDAQGQWDVVGDTFPVGCAFDDRIIFGTKSFEKNEDANHPLYSTKFAMIRYHFFSPWHREGAYHELMNDKDQEMLKAVLAFNLYELYSKSDEVPNPAELKDYYCELIDEYFPGKIINW